MPRLHDHLAPPARAMPRDHRPLVQDLVARQQLADHHRLSHVAGGHRVATALDRDQAVGGHMPVLHPLPRVRPAEPQRRDLLLGEALAWNLMRGPMYPGIHRVRPL